ncbi:ABC transporter permease [Novosphingobium ginsenosidimutans]|uniref:FtsX-like permease family protein n=1 Tax=Novosphingobium ginsenosidimutans TaxID=1176536 RepID=A0A5B8S0H5_9SPHN|nr:FtsX-like permease family protein [Novosphingobium ginsenosidimutans]QEA15021.1 FtsX-like permease family protein [Novosphingobium ginsenosidimutans]
MSETALSWSTAWTIARRDLSARFRGLRLLLACLFLGVGALAAIGTLTGAIEDELKSRGQTILGGDVQIEVWQRGATPAERAELEKFGKLSGGVRLQAMASSDETVVPIELKAVDQAWPLVGRLTLSDGRKVGAPAPGTAWVSPDALARLEQQNGGTFSLAGQTLKIAGVIADEPDRLSEGFALGPTVIVADGFPEAAGLTAPGAMYRSKYRLLLPAQRDPVATIDELKAKFPTSGFTYRQRDRAAPGADRFVSRMGEFLVLVGLTAMAIAGIGIGGGVSSYLEARRNSIATLKVLGATSRDITRIYLLQLLAAAVVGSLAGLLAGILVMPALGKALGALLPVAPGIVFDWAALARATAYGLLVGLVFAAPPLLAARRFPALALMRARVSPLSGQWREAVWPVGLGFAAIIGLTLASAAQLPVTAGFLAGAIVVLGLLGLLGWALRKLAARLPRPQRPLLRLALSNLHRPGAQTGSLVTALGFGLSAFVLLAVVQTSLSANIASRVPQRAPDYFMLDLPRDRAAEMERIVLAAAPQAKVRQVPALRGAILAYGPENAMTRVADLKEIPEEAWPLRGERGLTYSATLPEGNSLTAGQWWPKDYSGEPLVSVDEELAKAIDLKLGDKITIGVLGVERSARIASFRRIDWDSMGFNYVLVFSPNTLADAPHNLAATIDLPAGADRTQLLPQLLKAFPASSVIEVGGVLKQARELLTQVSTAILAAASVAVLAGIAVLLGAIAAARASRLYDNVVLRVLGASRRQLLLLQLAEYGLLALLLAGVALVLGSAIGWLVIVQLFKFDWLPNWPQVLAVLGAGLGMTVAFALAGSLPLLRAKPAQALREL